MGLALGTRRGDLQEAGRGCSIWSVAAVGHLEGPTALGGSLYQSGEAGGCWAGPGRPLRGWAEMLTVSHVLGSLQSPGVIPQETDIRACGLCPRQRLKRHPCRWRPPGCPLSPSAPQGAPPERKEARRAEEVAQLPTLTNSCPPRTPEGQEGAGRTAGMAGGREDEARGHGARGHRGHRGDREGAPGPHGAGSSERQGEGGKEGADGGECEQ